MRRLALILVFAVGLGATTELAVIQLKGGGTGTFYLSSVNGVLSWVTPPASAPSWQNNIVPSGTVNGTNGTFTLPTTPTNGASLQLFRNGLLQQQAATGDYTISGPTITFLATSIPQTGDILLVFYF